MTPGDELPEELADRAAEQLLGALVADRFLTRRQQMHGGGEGVAKRPLLLTRHVALFTVQTPVLLAHLVERGGEQPGAKAVFAAEIEAAARREQLPADGLHDVETRLASAQAWAEPRVHEGVQLRQVALQQLIEGVAIAVRGVVEQLAGARVFVAHCRYCAPTSMAMAFDAISPSGVNGGL